VSALVSVAVCWLYNWSKVIHISI